MWVCGVDVGLVKTGIAQIKNGRAGFRATITVHGDPEDTGPRYVKLAEAIKTFFERYKEEKPRIVAIEQPEHAIRRKGFQMRSPVAIMKLYGAFAVTYVCIQSMWPESEVIAVMPFQWKGRMSKSMTSRIIAAKYDIERFANDHEADALGLADWAWERLKGTT